MSRLLRAPLLHFLAIGGALLAVRTWWVPEETSRPRIVIATADVERLRQVWKEEHGGPPGAAAEEALIRDAIDEEVLYREALARGLDRRDDAVRERLVRLGGFVGEEAGGSRDALEREARRLGLERSDLVVRRHLVEMMRLASAWIGPEDTPSEADLEAYLGEHAAEFAQPARLRLTHVYLSEETRGAAAATDALALLDDLRATPGTAAGRGDAFIGGAEVNASRMELGRIFGPGFAEAVEAAPLRAWVGPVRSSYGLHLVRVHERQAARPAALDEVRGRVLHRLLRERRETREWAAMEEMRTGYVIEVAGRK